MRSLSSTLLTNQESDSANPYVTVDIGGGSSENHGVTTIDTIALLSSVSNICKSSNGNLYVLILVSNQFKIYKSTNGGDTWDGGTNIAGATDASYLVMAIDSNDYLHIAWCEDNYESSFSIYYTKLAASDYSVSISAEAAMDLSGPTRKFGSFGITIDSNDIPHIVVSTGVVT